jgi:hypothetical protein
MPSPFPGMNPYLEHPERWPEVHHRLITAIAIALASPLRPKYRVAIEKRTYLSDSEDFLLVGIPDVAVTTQKPVPTPYSTATLPNPGKSVTVTLPIPEEIREGYLEIREVATGYVITAIELLSPTNKRPGKGRQTYEEKRSTVLSSPTHLVEIDLLRGGQAMPILSKIPQTDYSILVARRNHRPKAELYGFTLQQEIPPFQLPLLSGDQEPSVDLQQLLEEVYEQAGFDLAIDYNLEPLPPFPEKDKHWADTLLREKGLRS